MAAPPAGEAGVVVGFDLDLTLIDTRPAVAWSLRAAAGRLGITLDVPRLLDNLGPDLADLVATQVEPDVAERVVALYRRIYAQHGPARATLLPGARAALATVQRYGGRAVVVTGQRDDSARRHLAHEGLAVHAVVGSVWGPAKHEALLTHGVAVYVGDHPADVAAARAAGASAVAVTTGRHDARGLAGADAVLASLEEFPAWFAGHRKLRPAG